MRDQWAGYQTVKDDQVKLPGLIPLDINDLTRRYLVTIRKLVGKESSQCTFASSANDSPMFHFSSTLICRPDVLFSEREQLCKPVVSCDHEYSSRRRATVERL
jgi:hypothetical protein